MRSVINVSLPATTTRQIRKEVREGGFVSTSEFFRHVWREWREQKLARELKRDRQQFEHGRGKPLRSLRDLR